MWNKIPRQRGFTLVELIIAMVIIGISLAAVVGVFNFNTVASARPIVDKQMRAFAEGLMEEIQHQPFGASANGAPSQPCARDTFNDIMDYNGYQQAKLCDINGTDLGLAGMTVQVAVGAPPPAVPLPGVAGGDAVQITITVTHGSDQVALRGWRTNFGKNQQ
ncbi:prepilin-type N-terminal cleavage/methylation domain-containing protein [Pseudoduganella sp. UC29_71]|jgi:MSHA pilin protein MshD|uniref:prepilin-type N-terminal cleavage/methylation domain-containing protein n=1 Tax=Pseudoduganella sp. UC29_71 TaxID=3350174 RepID=UPI00366D1E3F